MNKASKFLLMIVFLGTLLLTGCSKESIKGLNNITKQDHLCTVAIDGKEVEFPITLKELKKIGLGKIYDHDYQELRAAKNEQFGMTIADRTDFGLIYFMETLDAPSRGDENINVVGVYVRNATKEQFSLNEEVYIGISIDEAIKSLGDDYGVVAALNPDDLNYGTVRINYINDREHIIMDAKDGIIYSIEYSAGWTVE